MSCEIIVEVCQGRQRTCFSNSLAASAMMTPAMCQVCQREGLFQREGQSEERALSKGQELHS